MTFSVPIFSQLPTHQYTFLKRKPPNFAKTGCCLPWIYPKYFFLFLKYILIFLSFLINICLIFYHLYPPVSPDCLTWWVVSAFIRICISIELYLSIAVCRISSNFYYLFCDFQTLGSNLTLGSRHDGSKYQWKESHYTKDNLSYTYSNVRKITGRFATNDACQIQTIFCLLCLVDQHHHQRCITFVKLNSLKDPLTLVGHALSFVQTLGHEHKCLKSIIYLLHKIAFLIISNVCLQKNSLLLFKMIIFLPCSHENTWTAYCWAVQSWMSQSFGHLTAHNWQNCKRVFLTCPCHEINNDEAVGLKSCKYTWKITNHVNMWNLGRFREILIFCQ